MIDLEGTPYSLGEYASASLADRLREIEERVYYLRKTEKLSQDTVIDYYGRKRFEEIAESNAIEGSTLSVGETELAVLKGITITGHDPAYARDAVALHRALERAVEIARQKNRPIDITILKEIHALLLGDRPGAGMLRTERVRIRGSNHMPPKTYGEVLEAMENWENWSIRNAEAPAPFRSAVLHAWLAHIHPFIDGNGRSARAIGNMELIRAGYPSVIFRKRDRDRYINALSDSDEAGDIGGFLDLVLDKVDDSLTGLERSAWKKQGYSVGIERIRALQAQQMQIWNNGIQLLASVLKLELEEELQGAGGKVKLQMYNGLSELDDFLELCGGRSVPGSWAFQVSARVPGLSDYDALAFIGHRSHAMVDRMDGERGPSLFWSFHNPAGFPKWIRGPERSPYAIEITSRLGKGDDWMALLHDGKSARISTGELAIRIRQAILASIGSDH